MNPVYRPSTIKRTRRTREEVGQLDRQIFEALKRDHPQSIRHVFYLMTDPRLPEPVEKSDKRGYRHVQNRIVKMRRDGRLPYDWVVDATRMGYFTPVYRSAGDFIRSVAGTYRADIWAGSDVHCEVWCESRSIAGIIREDCREMAVSLYPAGGFSSISLAYEAAQTMSYEAAGKRAVVFYIGDYDPAGVLIDQSLERELRSHLDPAIELEFVRLGITLEQVEQFNLPAKPRKEGDRRARHIEFTVEAEAMPAGIMRRLLRDRIKALLPPRALEVAKVAEESERALMASLAEWVEGGHE